MKKILYTFLIAATLFACADTPNPGSVDHVIAEGNIETMKQKREQVLATYDSVGKLLSKLELAIAEKDTTISHPLVTVFQIKDTVFSHFISIQGNVETAENILIYPEYQGVLTKVYVKEGQKVSKGQLLAKIDDGGLSSQLSQLEIQYELTKTTYERQQRLWDQKIGSEMQLLQAKTNMESAENTVKQFRSQLGKTTISAPFSGVIDEIITDQGQVVAPGAQPLMRLINLGNMKVKAAVPENYIQSVTEGSKTMVTFPAIQATVEGVISNVGSYINPTNRTFQIEVELPKNDKKIKPNLMANLQINNYTNAQSVSIPSNAIQENAAGEKFVYVLSEQENDKAKVIRTKIETGVKSEGFIEVLSGLKDGDVIVKEGALTLKDGMTISIKQDN